MPSMDDVCARILAVGAPVLFLDTCSILDVIRAPFRDLRGCAEGASALLGLFTQSPPKCTLVVASLIPDEWGNHEAQTTEDLKKHLERMEEQASHFHDLGHLFSFPLSFGRPAYRASPLVNELRGLSKKLLDCAIRLDPDDGSKMKAFARVVANIPPSRKGGELKDCTILEECLEVCRRLQLVGFGPKRVFCTSNTNDYCETVAGLRPNLAVEFNAVGLRFTTRLPWAVHEVTH